MIDITASYLTFYKGLVVIQYDKQKRSVLYKSKTNYSLSNNKTGREGHDLFKTKNVPYTKLQIRNRWMP